MINNIKISPSYVASIINKLDKNKDGILQYDEFVNACSTILKKYDVVNKIIKLNDWLSNKT